MRSHALHIILLFLNHGLEIYINFNAQCFIVGLTLTALLFDVIHALSTLFSIDLQFFDLIEAARFLGESRTWSLTTLPWFIICSTIALVACIASLSWYT